MKKEAGKKSIKWLWLVGGVVLLAVVGVVLALVLGLGNEGDQGPKGGRPELYWNVDKTAYTENSETGLSTREPGEDGLYHVRFAINGEQIELPVADKRLINYIDTMDVMGLVQDADGIVVDVNDPKDIATEVAKTHYVQKVEGNKIIINSSLAMNGMRIEIELSNLTEIYDVTATAEVAGQIIDASAIQPMDTITVYANDLNENTHVYLVNHPTASKVYWRVGQQWDSSKRETSRVPDENGVYSMDFFCEGEVVTLKTKDRSIATKVDSVSRYSCHFGFIFDEEGYIVEYINSYLGIRALMACERWDVTAIEGDNVTITRLLTNDGSVWTGTIPADCPIYDVSNAAMSEGRQGKQVESLSMGDRVCVWTDTNGNPILIYISMHMVDSPAYWIVGRKYDSIAKETTRTPNARGYYEVELLKEGDTKNTTYYIKDKDTMSYLDSQTSMCVGLKVGEGNVVEYVYDSECLTGYSCATRGGVVTSVTGTIFSKITYGKPDTVTNFILAPGAKVYNVSQMGDYGAETTLQPGDHIYAYRQPTGELLLVFVERRQTGEDTLYYNLERLYDSETKTTTRVPDADGWYIFEMAWQGKALTLKTRSKEIATKVDSFSPGAVSLKRSGDVIAAVYDPNYAYSGAKIASGYRYNGKDADGMVNTFYRSGDTYKEVSFKMAEDCVIYNVSPVFDSFKGERIYSLKQNDMLTVFTNINGEAKVIYVRQRKVDNMYWKTDRLYDSTNECTKRVPDADGWYHYDLAVNGEVKSFKTNDIKIANQMDYYEGAFGLYVSGDVIKGFVGVSSVKNVKGNGPISWDVVSISGNKVTLKYNITGSTNTGKTQVVTLASNAKIYDVSPTAEKFGAAVKLQVGDRIRSYADDNGNQLYVYVQFHNTRKGGSEGYCAHCGKVVYWNPWKGGPVSYANNHWYLVADCTTNDQTSVGSESKDYSVCIDLNGHTLTRSAAGRFAMVRYGDTLSIMDSVGGGKIQAYGGAGYFGGVVMVNKGTLNLYSGTLEMLRDETIRNSYGGNVYIAGNDGVVNMYGGKITGGVSYAQSAEKPGFGGNIYVSAGTFNMSGGTVSGGEVYGDVYGETAVAGNGGNIYIVSGAKVNITGGTVTGGKAVKVTKEITNKDGKRENKTANAYGGNIYCGSTSGVLNITKATITDGEAVRGGNIYGTGTSVLKGATVSDGFAGQRGGNVMVTGGNWTFTDGTKILNGVTGNDTYIGNGGNIYIQGGELTLKKVTVDGGVATPEGGRYTGSGGNIYVYRDKETPSTVLNICDGAVISNGTATNCGDAIYVSSGTVAISGGTVRDDIYMGSAPDSITLSGAPVIEKLDMAGGTVKVTLGELSNGADISVAANGVFTEPCENAQAYADAQYIKAFDTTRIVAVTADKELTITGAPAPTRVAPCYCDEHNGADATWVDLNAYELQNSSTVSRLLNESGHYYLSDNFNMNAMQVNIGAASGSDVKVVLDLNGKTWTTTDRKAILVYGTLSIFDNAESGGGVLSATGVTNAHGGVIQIYPNATLNLYSGTVKMLESSHKVAQGGIATVAGTFNMYGGTLTGGKVVAYDNGSTHYNALGGAIYLSNDNAVFNMTGGTITDCVCEASGDSVYVAKGTAIISGGTINGDIYMGSAPKGITLSGEPVIELLDLTSGMVKVTLGELTGNASITVKAEGTFTEENNRAADYASFFHSADTAKFISVVDSGSSKALAVTDEAGGGNEGTNPNTIYETAKAMTFVSSEADGKVGNVVCPVCQANGDATGKDWYPLGTVASTRVTLNDGQHHHYYLSADSDYTNNGNFYYIQSATKVCLNLNGQTLVSSQRVFVVEGQDTVVNVMGDGNVTGKGSYNATAGNFFAAAMDVTGIVNMYGGTWTSANEYPAVGARGGNAPWNVINIYEGTKIVRTAGGVQGLNVYIADNGEVNMYGGTVSGGTAIVHAGIHATEKSGGNFFLKANTKNGAYSCALNIYGGTVTGGSAADKGGNIFAVGNTGANPTVAVTISGGTISDGSVYVTGANASITVSDAPVVSELDLTSGVLLGLGELKQGADITVIAADGVAFTDTIPANADTYATYFHVDDVKKGVVVSDSKLMVTDVCPHCAKAIADITWTDVAGGEVSSAVNLTADGHYRLTGDLTVTNGHGINLANGTSTSKLNVVLDLNGHSITASKRAIMVGKYNTFTVMDTVGGSTVKGLSATMGGSAIYAYDYTTFNMYDITANASDSTTGSGGAIYVSTSATFNMYSGVVNGTVNTGSGKMGGTVYVNKGTFNLYGGTINAGSVPNGDGDCMYVIAGSTLNVAGGTVNGEVIIAEGAAVKLSGAPVMTDLQLGNNVQAELGALTEGASITVTADGVFTAANENAQTYVNEEYIKAASGKTITVNADNTLSMSAAAAPLVLAGFLPVLCTSIF